jgi:predicted Zn finger-like uncharacterized protein
VYTQCSKCETVFKLSAEVLRVAGGQVRCGRCGEVFNALARLAEDSSGFSSGESPLDLETRADTILESTTTHQVVQTVATDNEEFVPPGVEIAQLEILDGDDIADADRSMEFTLPPGELDRIFVESKNRAMLPAVPQPAHQPEAQPAHQPAAQAAQQPAAQPAQQAVQQPAQQSVQPPLRQPAPPPAHPEARAEPEQDSESDPEPPQHPESAVVNAAASRNRVGGFEVPEDVRRDMLAEFEQRLQPQFVETETGGPNAQRRFMLWLGAAVASTLLLMAQVMHQNREWFVTHTHGPFGAGLRALYGAMGTPIPPPANLSAYQLRQWGVTGDPDANGTLRVRASILNTAAQLQPYPLLRVTLADRFGKRIGARDFEPGEYLGKPTARLLTPGERVDAMLLILDPGKNAEGFEIDVCLRGADQRISCANDVAPQAKR